MPEGTRWLLRCGRQPRRPAAWNRVLSVAGNTAMPSEAEQTVSRVSLYTYGSCVLNNRTVSDIIMFRYMRNNLNTETLNTWGQQTDPHQNRRVTRS